MLVEPLIPLRERVATLKSTFFEKRAKRADKKSALLARLATSRRELLGPLPRHLGVQKPEPPQRARAKPPRVRMLPVRERRPERPRERVLRRAPQARACAE